MSISLFWPRAAASSSSHHQQDGEGDASITAVGTSANNNRETQLDVDPSQPTSWKQKPAMRETVHDRALNELYSGRKSGDSTLAGSSGVAGGSNNAPPSAFPKGPEELFDPASGSLAGHIRSPPQPSSSDLSSSTSPPDNVNETRGSASDPASPAQPNEDMWNQLSKIRILQSEIARMHLALDRPGIVDSTSGVNVNTNIHPTNGSIPGNIGDISGRSRRGTAGTGGSRKDTAATDGPGKPSRSETAASAAGAAAAGAAWPDVAEDEFARRKESIGAIMSKLDALSVAVTEFHTLPAPPLDFPSPSSATSSRANSLQPFAASAVASSSGAAGPSHPLGPGFGKIRERERDKERERKIFSDQSMMSTFSSLSATGPATIPPKQTYTQAQKAQARSASAAGQPASARNNAPSPAPAPISTPVSTPPPTRSDSAKDYFYYTNRISSSPQQTVNSFTSHAGVAGPSTLPSSSSHPEPTKSVSATNPPLPPPPLVPRITTGGGAGPSKLVISTTAPPDTSSSSDFLPKSSVQTSYIADLEEHDGNDQTDSDDEREEEATPLIVGNKALPSLPSLHFHPNSSESLRQSHQSHELQQQQQRPPPPQTMWSSLSAGAHHQRLSTLYEPGSNVDTDDCDEQQQQHESPPRTPSLHSAAL